MVLKKYRITRNYMNVCENTRDWEVHEKSIHTACWFELPRGWGAAAQFWHTSMLASRPNAYCDVIFIFSEFWTHLCVVKESKQQIEVTVSNILI